MPDIDEHGVRCLEAVMMHISRFIYSNSTDRIQRYQMLLLHWARNIMKIYVIKTNENENEKEKNNKLKINTEKIINYEIKVRLKDAVFNLFYLNLNLLHEIVLDLFLKIGVQAILLLFDVELGKVSDLIIYNLYFYGHIHM
jgi:hypothetical protein